MHLSDNHPSGRLPKRFPVGTTYVVEGRGGEEGHLRVFSRYVVLPGGRRINLSGDFGGPASTPRPRQGPVTEPRREPGPGAGKSGAPPGAKKIMAGAGTSRRHGR